MKNKKYHTVGKLQNQISELWKEVKLIPLTHKYMTAHAQFVHCKFIEYLMDTYTINFFHYYTKLASTKTNKCSVNYSIMHMAIMKHK